MTQFRTLTVAVLFTTCTLLSGSAFGAPVLWLDADQFTAAQSNIATWPDRSPAGNDVSLSLGDGPDVVLGGLNGKPVVQFSADAMDTPGNVQFEVVFAVLNNTQGANFPNWNTALASSGCCPYTVQGKSGTSNLDTQWDSPNGTFYVNGVASTVFGPLADHKLVTKTLDSQADQQVRVGWDRNIGGRNWDGDFAEVIYFETMLTNDEITGINSILADKWGLPPIAATAAQIAAGNAALGIGPPPPPEVLGPNLVTDGSFEINTNSTLGNGQGSELGAHNYAGSAWGNADVTTYWDKNNRVWYVTDNGDVEFPDGDFAYRIDARLDIDGADKLWLWQDDISLTAGQEYQFSFEMWGESGAPILDVELTGSDTIVLFDDTTTNPGDGVAETKSVRFTPTVTGSYSVEFFTDVNNGNNHAWIDDVRLQAVLVVPEPLTMLAVGLAVAGLGGYVRKRHVPSGRRRG